MRKIILVLSLCALPFAAVAEDKSSGCGLGWKVTKKKGLLSSTTRSYTNSTFSNTFGMTSGTSGCAKHSLAKKDRLDQYYAEANFNQLMVEMAQGEGEYLQAFALTLGCTPSDTQAFSELMQNQYSEIYTPEVTPGEMLQNVKTQMSLDPVLASHCTQITG